MCLNGMLPITSWKILLGLGKPRKMRELRLIQCTTTLTLNTKFFGVESVLFYCPEYERSYDSLVGNTVKSKLESPGGIYYHNSIVIKISVSLRATWAWLELQSVIGQRHSLNCDRICRVKKRATWKEQSKVLALHCVSSCTNLGNWTTIWSPSLQRRSMNPTRHGGLTGISPMISRAMTTKPNRLKMAITKGTPPEKSALTRDVPLTNLR